MPREKLLNLITSICRSWMSEGRLVGLFGIYDLLALLVPRVAVIGNLLPNLRSWAMTIPSCSGNLRPLKGSPVRRAVNREAARVYTDTPLIEAIRLFCRNHMTIPVVERGSERLVGMISYWDAARHIVGSPSQSLSLMTQAVEAGTSAMLLPIALFVLSYAAIMTERVNRAVVALLGRRAGYRRGNAQSGRSRRRDRFQHAGAADGHDDHRRDRQEERRFRLCRNPRRPADARAARGNPPERCPWSRQFSPRSLGQRHHGAC
jgi:CBS domain-containing protein